MNYEAKIQVLLDKATPLRAIPEGDPAREPLTEIIDEINRLRMLQDEDREFTKLGEELGLPTGKLPVEDMPISDSAVREAEREPDPAHEFVKAAVEGADAAIAHQNELTHAAQARAQDKMVGLAEIKADAEITAAEAVREGATPAPHTTSSPPEKRKPGRPRKVADDHATDDLA